MAWTTPLTAVANATLTAAQWNASVRDNLNMTGPALASAAGQMFVSTAANTIAVRAPDADYVSNQGDDASSTYGDLTTAGPTVTMATGARAIVAIYCNGFSSASTGAAIMSYAVSGATTLAASDTWSISFVGTAGWRAGGVSMQEGLTPGTNTFTAKYRQAIAGTASFIDRRLAVIPL